MSFVVETDSFSESGMAVLISTHLFEDRFIHVAGLGWLAYRRGHVWSEVDDKVPVEAARRWTAAQLHAAVLVNRATPEDDPGKAWAAWVVKAWRGWQGNTRLNNVLKLCRGICSVDMDQLDAKPDVLNCPNGVVYLPTGDLTPSNPKHYFTKTTGVDYDPTAVHEDWTAALTAVPAEVEPWLRVRYGQAATGHPPSDDVFVVQDGGGENGKSTVMAGVLGALGDYFLTGSPNLLVNTSTGGHSTEVAGLRGARFVSFEETPETGQLDIAGIKRLVGSELRARHLYQREFSFSPSHSMFLNTNYAPTIRETDHGTWRRLLMVPFPVTFGQGGRPKDTGLRPRIKAGTDGQHKAVLAWLVEGATQWYEAGREFPATPQMVLEATAEWRDRSDTVSQFWSDVLTPDSGSWIYGQDLIWAFNQYQAQAGHARIAEPTFLRRFRTHPNTTGFMVTKTKVNQGPELTLKNSRPHLLLDAHSRMAEVPGGQVRAWVGVRFRHLDEPEALWKTAGHGHADRSDT